MALCVSSSECLFCSLFRFTKYYHFYPPQFSLLLQGHGHWINSLALSTEYVLRTGAFDHTGRQYPPNEEKQKVSFSLHYTLEISFVLIPWFSSLIWKFAGFYLLQALERYNQTKGDSPERLVSGSDDFTMFLWEPSVSKQPKKRLTGHQQVSYLKNSLFLPRLLVLFLILMFKSTACKSCLFLTWWEMDCKCIFR